MPRVQGKAAGKDKSRKKQSALWLGQRRLSAAVVDARNLDQFERSRAERVVSERG